MKWTAISICALLASGVACSTSTTATKTPEAPESAGARPPPKVHAPEWLPVQAREMLTSRMQRHGEEMMYLTAMVLTVNYEGAAHLAQHIAEEPRIPRPTAGEQGTISQLLPERFFQLQDELNERAKTMAAAAREQHQREMIEAYSRLTETCVSCHVLYMRDDDGPRPEDFDLESDEREPETPED